MSESKSLFTSDEIYIETPAQTIWEVLINPEMTKQYMFGCEVICDWEIGSPILWKGVQDGVVYVKGNLLQFDPCNIFSFSVFDPNATYPDIPENYLVATYTLSEKNNRTHLKVIQGDYLKVADGQKRYQDSIDGGGWAPVLESIRKLSLAFYT
jgi:uncharacterized protein YndB with AHSA1/START domain